MYIVHNNSTTMSWKCASVFLLGEELPNDRNKAGFHIHNLLITLLQNVQHGCCPNVGMGYQCGHCNSSRDVIRISRALVLSLHEVPSELSVSQELETLRSWIREDVVRFLRVP